MCGVVMMRARVFARVRVVSARMCVCACVRACMLSRYLKFSSVDANYLLWDFLTRDKKIIMKKEKENVVEYSCAF